MSLNGPRKTLSSYLQLMTLASSVGINAPSTRIQSILELAQPPSKLLETKSRFFRNQNGDKPPVGTG